MFHIKSRKDKSGNLKSEPEKDDEPTLTIELQVDSGLEPKWTLKSSRLQEEREISHKDRSALCVFFLGNLIDREFSWNKGSAISKLTEEDDEISRVITKANRSARGAVEDSDFFELQKTARTAKDVAGKFGVSVSNSNFRPALDGQSWGIISLYDNAVPFRLSGLGSRRLLGIGLQKKVTEDGSILLVDEVEQGLEPYRLRHLIHSIDPQQKEKGQTFITTHSPIVISQLTPEKVFFVQNNAGAVKIKPLSDFSSLHKCLQEVPEVFLTRKAIICEGQTEYEICSALDRAWSANGNEPLASIGAVPFVPIKSGGYTKSPKIAKALAEIGFETLYFGDSDQPIDPNEETLKAIGVKVLLWAGKNCTEQIVFDDIPWDGVVDLVCSYIEIKKEEKEETEDFQQAITTTAQHIKSFSNDNNVADQMMRSLQANDNYRQTVYAWKDQFNENEVRQVLGAVANKRSWFKSTEHASLLANLVIKYLETTDSSKDLVKKIDTLKQWVYGK